MDSEELIERYLLLLLGAKDRPIPSALHLQKEMFLLANFKESLKEELNFEKHYYGPFSQTIDEAIRSPTYFSESFSFQGDQIMLSKNGIAEFNSMIKENRGHKEFDLLISGLVLIREIYDQLSRNELLLLIYCTYPEYTTLSKVSDKLLKNKVTKHRILSALLAKQLITEQRFEELKNER
jgi:hypothetical protein